MDDNYVAISAARAQAGKPGDQSLIQDILQDIRHLKEMMGKSYTAGAAADHNHDGVNSARVEVGSNFIRNSDFESGSAGWLFEPNGQGTVGVETGSNLACAKYIKFDIVTSGSMAGTATTTEYVSVTGGSLRQFVMYFRASAANLPIKVEALWYDGNLSSSATTTLADGIVPYDAGNPMVLLKGRTRVPDSARYVRLKITAGGSGTATGAIYVGGIAHTFPYDFNKELTWTSTGLSDVKESATLYVWGALDVVLAVGGGGGAGSPGDGAAGGNGGRGAYASGSFYVPGHAKVEVGIGGAAMIQGADGETGGATKLISVSSTGVSTTVLTCGGGIGGQDKWTGGSATGAMGTATVDSNYGSLDNTLQVSRFNTGMFDRTLINDVGTPAEWIPPAAAAGAYGLGGYGSAIGGNNNGGSAGYPGLPGLIILRY